MLSNTLSTMTWNQGWKMKTVESRIAFSRFIFEDAEQCALQGGKTSLWPKFPEQN